MRNRPTSARSGAIILGQFALISLLLCLIGCAGTSSHTDIIGPPPGPPNVSGISPSSGVSGASVTISGSNFGAPSGSNTVTFNGTQASVANWSGSAIVVKVPSGATTGNVVVTIGGTASNGVKFTVVALPTGSIALSNFGFQCGPGSTQDCEGPGNTIVWPGTQAQPGLLRLHDSGTQWAVIDPVGGGSYVWTDLDAWLDLIAQRQPLSVSQVFTWVPCWDAPTCLSPPTAPAGTNSPPSDLTTSGSPSFNNFVTAFVQHCSPAGNCVSKYIKYYEMWNEWDLQYHWTGSMAQVYQMVAPAVAIIRANVPSATILMPSATPSSDTGLGYLTDFQNWLNYEDTNGRISDWVDWHVYLTAQTNNQVQIDTPEDQWSNYNANFLSVQYSDPNWKSAPWANTETNFNGSPPPGLNYTCPTSSTPNPPITFSADDCTGMIVRWQLLHASNGGANVDWYKWNETIGLNSQYEAAYYYMMQYMVGGKFSAPCSFTAGGGSSTWTCNFTEANGTTALWVWTPSETVPTTFTVPTGYVDYLDLTGKSTSVTAGSSITIGVEPIMLEQ